MSKQKHTDRPLTKTEQLAQRLETSHDAAAKLLSTLSDKEVQAVLKCGTRQEAADTLAAFKRPTGEEATDAFPPVEPITPKKP